jgi:hypothetical protein
MCVSDSIKMTTNGHYDTVNQWACSCVWQCSLCQLGHFSLWGRWAVSRHLLMFLRNDTKEGPVLDH